MIDTLYDRLQARAEISDLDVAVLLREAASAIASLTEERGRFGEFEGDALQINIDDPVLFLVTDWMLRVMREDHDDAVFLLGGGMNRHPFQHPRVDRQGRVRTNLREYMRVFGRYMDMDNQLSGEPAMTLWLTETGDAKMLRELGYSSEEADEAA